MALTAGTRLGPYEIEEMIGAGGMGEVYRARDHRLERMVAVKVLGDASGDPEFRERFRREARALSRLSHPNVCAVYDVGTEDAKTYFVMELLDGETLATRLDRGPLPVERTLEIAIQIATALETSHRIGLVHRDLKPANIMLTPSGVKLLDFGLVRFTGVGSIHSRDTVSDALTIQGALLGTIQYMSPEQIEGREADARSDLFSFGAVLYEMITGRRAFAGDTQASWIAAILKEDPPSILAVQPTPPRELDALIRSCLSKSPDNRWQSAHDLRLELSWITDRLRRSDDTPSSRRIRSRFWIAAAALSASVAAVLIGQELLRGRTERPAIRALIPAAQDSQFVSVGTHAGPAVLSPDGRRLAYVATSRDERLRLWIRSLDSVVTQSLAGTEGASYPFWSADGEQVGFFADRKLKTVTVASGAIKTLCEVTYGAGGTWNRDGTIVFAPGLNGGLLRIPSAGGSPRSATSLNEERRESTHRWPMFLPDGRRFLYTVGQQTKAGQWAIRVGSLDSSRVDDVIEGHSNAQYANGSLIFARNGTLLAQRVDERSLRATGDPVPLAEDVLHDVGLGRAVFSASQRGTLVYQIGSAVSGSRLVWLDRTGKEVGLLGEKCFCIWPRLSPDGRRVAVAITDASTGNGDIWIYELADGRRLHLTFEEALETNPVWIPDGSRIVFTSTRSGFRDIHWMDALGSGSQEPLLKSDRDKTTQSASSEGVIFAQDGNLWLLPLTGKGTAQPLLDSEHTEHFGQISPDGRWLLYQSDEGGKNNVYVTSFPARSGRWLVSENGGILPRWSASGQEIFYLTQDHSTLFAAAVTTQAATFSVSSVQRLFSAPMIVGRGFPYDVSRDGTRFLVVVSSGATATPLTLVIDWPSEVKH